MLVAGIIVGLLASIRSLFDGSHLAGSPDPSKRQSIVHLMDASGSMSGKKLKDAKKALHAFNDKIRWAFTQAALIVFGPYGRASVQSKFGATDRELQRSIDRFSASNGTPMNHALELAEQMLQHVDNEKIIVVASDGLPNDKPQNVILGNAKRLKQQGVRIITIVIGKDADKEFLRKLASSDQDFHTTKHSGQLIQTYEKVAKGLVARE